MTQANYQDVSYYKIGLDETVLNLVLTHPP
jgi:hypothetical protein